MAVYDTGSERIIVRIVYDGLQGAGKSTHIRQLAAQLKAVVPPPCTIPGAIANEAQSQIDWIEVRAGKVEDRRVDCQVIAVPSSERFLRLRPHLYQTADVVVLVADSTAVEPARFQRHVIALRHTGRDRKLLLVANKQDLPGALPPSELAQRLGQLSPFATLPSDAARGVGVHEAFEAAIGHTLDALRALVREGRLSAIAGSGASLRQLRDVIALYSPRNHASDHGRALSAHLRDLASARVTGVATVTHGATAANVVFSEGLVAHVEYPVGDASVEDGLAQRLGLDPQVAAELRVEARARGDLFATAVATQRLAPGSRLLPALQDALRSRLAALVGEMSPRFHHQFTAGPQRVARALLTPLEALLASPEPQPSSPVSLSKEKLMSTESIIKRAQKDIPKCVAAGIVDLDSGMLLNVKTVDSHPQEVLDLVAAATRDLYEGDNVTAIENMFKRIRGTKTDEHYFQQIIVMSRNLIHFFGRLTSNQRIVIVAVCRADANLGLILAQGRAICTSESI